MTKDVLIKITGLHFEEGNRESVDNEEIQVLTKGEYYHRNGKNYLVYDEMLEGFDEVNHCRVKYSDDSFELLKKGSSNVHMVFQKGKKNQTYYQTPYGTMVIGLDTRDITVEEQEENIQIQVKYGMDVNYNFIADCDISIEIQPLE